MKIIAIDNLHGRCDHLSVPDHIDIDKQYEQWKAYCKKRYEIESAIISANKYEEEWKSIPEFITFLRWMRDLGATDYKGDGDLKFYNEN